MSAQTTKSSNRSAAANLKVLAARSSEITEKRGHLPTVSKSLPPASFSLHANPSNISTIGRARNEDRVVHHLPASPALFGDPQMTYGENDGLSDQIGGIQNQLGKMMAMARARIEPRW